MLPTPTTLHVSRLTETHYQIRKLSPMAEHGHLDSRLANLRVFHVGCEL